MAYYDPTRDRRLLEKKADNNPMNRTSCEGFPPPNAVII